MGKPEAEVIAAVGKPDETSVDNDATYWHFKKRTRDPLTGDRDTDVQVVIKHGKVARSIIDGIAGTAPAAGSRPPRRRADL